MALRVRPDGWVLCEDAQRGPRHRCVKYKFAIESCEGLELHRFAVRFSDAQEQHRQLLSLGLLDSGVAFKLKPANVRAEGTSGASGAGKAKKGRGKKGRGGAN